MISILHSEKSVQARKCRTEPDQRVIISETLVTIDERGKKRHYLPHWPQVQKLLNFLNN